MKNLAAFLRMEEIAHLAELLRESGCDDTALYLDLCVQWERAVKEFCEADEEVSHA